MAIFLLVFGVFGVWSALAPLDGAAFAATVTVKSYNKVAASRRRDSRRNPI